jgi:hypothetical protein
MAKPRFTEPIAMDLANAPERREFACRAVSRYRCHRVRPVLQRLGQRLGPAMTESNAQTRALADLAYEIDQLRGAYAHLVEQPADKVIRNALIESFATHARCLLEFFSGIRKSVRATVYTDLDYKLLSVEQVRSWHARISNQISQLQVGRPTDDLKKIDATDLSIIHS